MFLFTYGTLKRGQRLHRWLENQGGVFFIQEAETSPFYALFEPAFPIGESFKFPYMVRDPSPEGKRIKGELYQILNSGLLNELDAMEAIVGLKREVIHIPQGLLKAVPLGTEVYAYIFNDNPLKSHLVKVKGNFWPLEKEKEEEKEERCYPAMAPYLEKTEKVETKKEEGEGEKSPTSKDLSFLPVSVQT